MGRVALYRKAKEKNVVEASEKACAQLKRGARGRGGYGL